jgi:hypothetical protein
VTREIKIPSKDEVFTALVDDEDFPVVSRHKWYILWSKNLPYAFTKLYNESGKGKTFLMHHLILGSSSQVDHENHNTLDNQKGNMRPATHQENGWNKGKPKRRDGKAGSQFKGVVRCRRVDGTVYWRVIVKLTMKGEKPERFVRLGPFSDEIEAARAYNEEIVKHRGKFAWVNPLPDVNQAASSRDRGTGNG